MKGAVFTITIVGFGMTLLGTVAMEASQAREFESQKLEYTDTSEWRGLSENGNILPDPPGDPECPYGAVPVGSISIRTFAQLCTVNGKEVTRVCISKTQLCEEGVAVPPAAYRYNCAPCVESPSLAQ